jgi:membrane fusion protein (multidrug efflux system)
LVRRHFFLAAALAILVLMVVAGGLKMAFGKHGAQQGPGGPGASQGQGAPAGKGGGGGRGGRGGAGGAAQVSVATVQRQSFVDAIDVLGVAKGRQSVTLTAAATQLVDRVRFSDGQSVAKGAILVELRDTEQDAGVGQAKARLVEAERAYQRYKALNDKGFASRAQLEGYEATWRSAQADVAAAEARQNDRMIRAPFSGVVGLSDIAPGSLVNPGAPIVTLDDLSTMRVDFQVPERYLGQLSQGQAITAAVDAYPGEQIQGRIALLDTRIDERTRAITARAEFPNPNRKLKAGMMMRVSIARGQRQALAAPESAVAVQGDSAFVFVVRKDGKRTTAEQRPVVTGIRQNGVVEILDGAEAGEQIVADGLNKVQPGQAIHVQGAGGPGAGGAGGAGGHKGPGAGDKGAGGQGQQRKQAAS